MKPVEETWEAMDRAGNQFPVFGICFDKDRMSGAWLMIEAGKPHEGELEKMSARAKLAACAPEMARLLMSAEWGGDGAQCPFCGSFRPDHPIDPLERPLEHPHEDGCELFDVLEKAGIWE